MKSTFSTAEPTTLSSTKGEPVGGILVTRTFEHSTHGPGQTPLQRVSEVVDYRYRGVREEFWKTGLLEHSIWSYGQLVQVWDWWSFGYILGLDLILMELEIRDGWSSRPLGLERKAFPEVKNGERMYTDQDLIFVFIEKHIVHVNTYIVAKARLILLSCVGLYLHIYTWTYSIIYL